MRWLLPLLLGACAPDESRAPTMERPLVASAPPMEGHVPLHVTVERYAKVDVPYQYHSREWWRFHRASAGGGHELLCQILQGNGGNRHDLLAEEHPCPDCMYSLYLISVGGGTAVGPDLEEIIHDDRCRDWFFLLANTLGYGFHGEGARETSDGSIEILKWVRPVADNPNTPEHDPIPGGFQPVDMELVTWTPIEDGTTMWSHELHWKRDVGVWYVPADP